MLGFLKPRHIREAEAFFSRAIKQHQQLRLVFEDQQQFTELSADIVQSCLEAIRRDRKFGDAYIVAADVISFWGEDRIMHREYERAALLLSMAAFALQEWSMKGYFTRNAARGREVRARILDAVRELPSADATLIDPQQLDARWREDFFSAADSIVRQAIVGDGTPPSTDM